MAEQKVRSEVLTIMFVDVVGYTKTTSRLGREDIDKFHNAFDAICKPVFERHNGTLVKKIGDAFLVTFTSPTDAMICGVELQNSFRSYNKEYPSKTPLKIRVALHSGEVVLRGNDIYGDAVNAAARIEGVVKEGDVVFSEAVYHSMNKNEIPYLYLGEKRFKGIRRPLKIFKVKGAYDEIIRRRKRMARSASRVFRKILFVLFIFALLALVVYGAYYYFTQYSQLLW